MTMTTKVLVDAGKRLDPTWIEEIDGLQNIAGITTNIIDRLLNSGIATCTQLAMLAVHDVCKACSIPVSDARAILHEAMAITGIT